MNTNLKFALKARNSKDEALIVLLELDIDKLEVSVQSKNSMTLSDSDIESTINKWNKSEEIDAEGLSEIQIVKFTDESILPNDIKVDKDSFKLRQIQNEWSYAILNAKLFQQFNTELEILKQKAEEVNEYNHDLWQETKEFWEKLLEYKKENEITQDKLNFFKEEVNVIFEKLKLLKEKYLLEKDEVSNQVLKEYSEKIEEIYENLKAKDVHFNTQIESLKHLQHSLKEKDVKRDVKNQLYNDFQKLFETIQSTRKQKFGANAGSRVEGLNRAKAKIEKSLQYDLKDLKFNEDKVAKANNKLEEQLREAKINVLNDRIESKKEKIADIQKTIDKLSKSIQPTEKIETEENKTTPKEGEKLTVKEKDTKNTTEETSENE